MSNRSYFEFTDAVPLLTPRGGTPELINDDLADVAAQLRQFSGPFALDAERAGNIRYSHRAYLIQIKRAESPTFLIDPVGLENQFEPLIEAMHDEWILHAADQDLPCLRELGLQPKKIFDTEIAGLILGFERVSLQAMIAEVLGYALAKEHSAADWSQRPLPPEMLDYAALDVELLGELREQLIVMLESARRRDWFEQECDEVLHRPEPRPKQQPWRRTARRLKIQDRRALEMLRRLWDARDALGKHRDQAPATVISNERLGILAARKPRSLADVQRSQALNRRILRHDAQVWWDAIREAWSVKPKDLPERDFREARAPYPPTSRWPNANSQGAKRLERVHTAVVTHADHLGIRQEVLLKPAAQRHVAWHGWKSLSQLEALLEDAGARPWQIEQIAPRIFHS